MKLLNIKHTLSALAMVSLLLVSCEEDTNQDYSPLVKSNPTVTNSVASYDASFEEQDTTFLFALEASETQIVDIPVYINVMESVGFTGDEYSLTNGEISKGSTACGPVEISFEQNEMPSIGQTLSIQVGDDRTYANAEFTPTTYTYSVRDYDAMVEWGNCDADFDMYLYDENGNDTGIYGAATGDCPETIDFATVPDGTYLLGIQIYYSQGDVNAAGAADEPLPFTGEEFNVVFSGSNNGGEALHTMSIAYTPNATYTVTDNPYPQPDTYSLDGGSIQTVLLGSVTKNGSTVTISDANGDVVGTM